MGRDVFISYSNLDHARASEVLAGLERVGIACFMAPRDLLAGRAYAGQIVEAISASKVVLLILSPASNASKPVLKEIETASNHKKSIIPFRLADVTLSTDLEFYLQSVHWMDAMDEPIESSLIKLASSIRAHIGTTHAQPNAPVRPQAQSRGANPTSRPKRSALIGTALVASLVAGGSTLWLSHPEVAVRAALAPVPTTRPRAGNQHRTDIPTEAIVARATPTPRIIVERVLTMVAPAAKLAPKKVAEVARPARVVALEKSTPHEIADGVGGALPHDQPISETSRYHFIYDGSSLHRLLLATGGQTPKLRENLAIRLASIDRVVCVPHEEGDFIVVMHPMEGGTFGERSFDSLIFSSRARADEFVAELASATGKNFFCSD